MMKGEGCVDKPVATIWNNYLRSPHPGLEMKLVLTGSGLKAYTKEQGLTEYRAHRISYCIAHPGYPKLFVWVYRHEAKRMKMELRCHAVLCRSEVKAKAMALQLHERLTFALQEFQRDKLRKQNSRLVLLRTNSLPKAGCVLPLRKQLLSTATNFKPPACKSTSAPKLGAIHEDHEEEEDEEEEEEEEDEDLTLAQVLAQQEEEAIPEGLDGQDLAEVVTHAAGDMLEALDLVESASAVAGDFHSEPLIDVEMGNDIEELRGDRDVQFCLHQAAEAAAADSDEESAESGFHDQDDRGQGSLEQDGGLGPQPVVDGGQEVVMSPMGDQEGQDTS
ncbi:protein FAM43B-like [Babylonia areolata]|uniref:protein FAM43B-like n=1 Tax=Babylonia areolata TaxID=304850 RepID=UPI003FCF4FBB